MSAENVKKFKKDFNCLMYYYDCMDDYYYSRGICKYCGSRDITWLEADHKESMKCWTCGSRLYKDW
ncbi:MAG: hypothetical protein K6C35_05975 [Eubacterium sp.]|nr:hypothetical protein [Eubacterium sp.]